MFGTKFQTEVPSFLESQVEGSLYAKTELNPFSLFDRTPTCDERMDEQTDKGL